jgi:O-antigen biosynthesis protein
MMQRESSIQRGGVPGFGRLTAIAQRIHHRLQRYSYDYRVWSEWLGTRFGSGAQRAMPSQAHKPLISIRMGVATVQPRHLRRAVESVLAQRYPYWELRVDVDATATPAVLTMLARYQASDQRVIVRHDAVEPTTVATSPFPADETFIVWLNPDDALARDALEHVARAVGEHQELQILYGDEDSLTRFGRRVEPRYKPDWSPHLLRSHNFIGRPWFVRSDLLSQLNVPRFGCDAGREHDILLQVAELVPPGSVHHIRRMLYHRCPDTQAGEADSGSNARLAEQSRLAVEAHLRRCDIAATVESIPDWAGFNRISYVLEPKPLLSVIIPSRDKVTLLKRCMTGLRERTDYPAIELVILDNGSVEPDTLAYLSALAGQANVQVLRVDAPFNFSALCNRGARAAHGDLFCFLNNDMEITHGDWLDELVSLAVQPEIGAVAPLLRYPDGRIQHLGIRVDPPWPRLIGDGWREPVLRRDAVRLHAVHDVSAVNGGCLVTRRDVFTAVGGFDEALPVASNDVDFCFAVRKAGYWVVVTPFAELNHELFASRRDVPKPDRRRDWQESIRSLQVKWPDQWGSDPYLTVSDRA